jgi:hypothetical protein
MNVLFTSSLGWTRVNATWTRVNAMKFVPTTAGITTLPNTSVVSREDLIQEAAALTRSLYRRCLRSVKVIRWGNEFDDLEFAKREEEFVNPQRRGSHSGTLSMAPPPNKEDELRSRAEYYRCYAREYFVQESDCLDNEPLMERDIRRYLYYLRKGEKDRKWLLGDMMFADPYKNAVDQDRIDKFESMSRQYLGVDKDDDDGIRKAQGHSSTPDPTMKGGFEEDEDPEWFQTKFPHLR